MTEIQLQRGSKIALSIYFLEFSETNTRSAVSRNMSITKLEPKESQTLISAVSKFRGLMERILAHFNFDLNDIICVKIIKKF